MALVPTSKYTETALRDLAAMWAEGSIPHRLLTMVADVLRDFFDQDPDWHLQLAPPAESEIMVVTRESTDPAERLCTCGHPLKDHHRLLCGCAADACGCSGFVARDYFVGHDPAAPGQDDTGRAP